MVPWKQEQLSNYQFIFSKNRRTWVENIRHLIPCQSNRLAMNKEKFSCEFRSFVYFPQWIFMSFTGRLIAAERQNIILSSRIKSVTLPSMSFAFLHIIAVLAQFCFNLHEILALPHFENRYKSNFFPYCFRLAVPPPSLHGMACCIASSKFVRGREKLLFMTCRERLRS